MTTEERFELIEAMMAKFAEGMNQLREGQKDLQAGQKDLQSGQKDLQARHKDLELETAQVNQLKAHTKLEEALARFSTETAERINNLTILVDRLVARDLGNSPEGI